VPAITDEERAAWREQNADLIAFISNNTNCQRSRFINSMRGSYIQWGSLTAPQTTATRNIMNEMGRSERGSDEAALGHECPSVPNGTFTVSDAAGRTETFKVHTVRHGVLQDKRVIKRQIDGAIFKAFGFLTRDGSLRVWRSYYEDEAAGASYIHMARMLLRAIDQCVEIAEVQSGLANTSFEINHQYQGVTYTIQASTLCRVCNRELTDPTSIRLGIGPDCRRERVVLEEPEVVTEPSITTADPRRPTPEDYGDFDEPDIPAPVVHNPNLDRRLLALIRHTRNEYRLEACDYCGRDDFMQPQGRGRHISACRRRNGNRTLLERHAARVDELRTMGGPSGQPYRPPTTARAQRPIPAPNLSALGTRIGGSVWAQ